MVDGQGNQLPTIPILGPLEPWINLLHTVGMPWAIILLSAYYGIPYAKDISAKADTLSKIAAQQEVTNQKMEQLDAHAKRAMPMLEEASKAVPLLQQISKATKEGAAQRHKDLDGLRSDARGQIGNPGSELNEDDCQ